MKKNILTIIIMAIVLINTVLTGVLIFVIVPTSNKTTDLVAKVASIVDLELESPDSADTALTFEEMTSYNMNGGSFNLKVGSDGAPHYAVINTITLTMNNTHEDYTVISEKLEENANRIAGIVSSEIGKYSMGDVNSQQSAIEQAILARVQELFQSDCIINISLGIITTS